jgi:hypothetical protein
VAQREVSSGADLLSVFVSTLVTAPFGYVAAGIILGDADAGTALRRSTTLARARPRLAVVVATFAFLAGVLELFGIGAAADAVGRIIAFEHLSFDPTGGDVLVALPVIAAALIALGSLGLTVAAIVAAPQVIAFLGLTHYSAGLDRVISPARDPAMYGGEPPGGGHATLLGSEAAVDPAAAPESAWVRGAEPHPEKFRWVTIPMLVLIVFAAFIAIAGLIAAA